jgi:DNA-binding NtrC family response regulator
MHSRMSVAVASDSQVFRRDAMFCASRAMLALEEDIDCAVRCDVNVMVSGERGVGKTSVARRIHFGSRRGRVPLVISRTNDAAGELDPAMLNATHGATVLVEDPERLSPAAQGRLLRFIEQRATRGGPAGRTFVPNHGLRFITTTRSDLFELVRRQRFDESLFYRLNAIHLVVPPLRVRREDIPPLLCHFMSQFARTAPRLSPAAWDFIVKYPWPGNIRELKALAATLASIERRMLQPSDLPPEIQG